jgi:hypothetical protein
MTKTADVEDVFLGDDEGPCACGEPRGSVKPRKARWFFCLQLP